MNHYTQVTAKDTIPGVTPNDLDDLENKLEGTGLSAELWNIKGKGKKEKGDLYLYSEEYFDEDSLVDSGALPVIGQLLKKAKMPFVQLGMACYGSKAAKDSSGGAEFRIYPDGEIVWADITWPTKKPKKQKVWVIQVHCRDGADDFVTVDGAFSTAAKAKARMKQYSNRKRSEETGETYYSPDEMKLVCLEVE